AEVVAALVAADAAARPAPEVNVRDRAEAQAGERGLQDADVVAAVAPAERAVAERRLGGGGE
ncbi:MAG TPA: hypothetical protein VGR12_05170, partial [Solirubrobacteraceae bacterium]|nr:hypothetical protein [Solirubrobacteraceae bacterium]